MNGKGSGPLVVAPYHSHMIRDSLASAIRTALGSLGVDAPSEISLERPRNAEHGDWSSNVALAVAKTAGRNPRELAGSLAELLGSGAVPHVTAVEIAGPGFLNFRLADTWLHDVLTNAVVSGPDQFGRVDLGHGRTVNVEFVSANPTGPLHAGHGRGACFGDSLARILGWAGYVPNTEFYVNDRGTQIATYAASLVARRAGEQPPEGGYVGQYIIDWAAEMPADADPVEWGLVKAHDYQVATLAALNIRFDRWSSERELVASGAMEVALESLRAGGYIYELDGATWLRTTDFGDDKDRVLIRSDGQPTYFMPDIAYHLDKFNRGSLLINVLGADHHGYVARMKAAVQALGHEPDDLDIVIGQQVMLMRDGVEVKLSKRSGDIIELQDVIDEVGVDSTRFTYLLQSMDTRQVFDMGVVVKQSMDNPVFYVQYAHARVCAIQRQAVERGVVRGPLGDTDLSLLSHQRELDVLRVLYQLPDAVRMAATDRAPHKITTWVRELAGVFHSFYHDCYVMGDGVSVELTQARLWLVESARVGLVVGLTLLGVSTPEKM